jgi:hypothetical protein
LLKPYVSRKPWSKYCWASGTLVEISWCRVPRFSYSGTVTPGGVRPWPSSWPWPRPPPCSCAPAGEAANTSATANPIRVIAGCLIIDSSFGIPASVGGIVVILV